LVEGKRKGHYKIIAGPGEVQDRLLHAVEELAKMYLEVPLKKMLKQPWRSHRLCWAHQGLGRAVKISEASTSLP
jgi:hypothetical protein